MLNLVIYFALFFPAMVAVLAAILPKNFFNKWYLAVVAASLSFFILVFVSIKIFHNSGSLANYLSSAWHWSQTWNYAMIFQFNALTITILLVSSLTFLLSIVLSRFELEQDNAKIVAALMHCSCTLAAITSQDLFFFGFFSMASLLPIVALIGWDTSASRSVGLKYFFYCNFIADLFLILVSLYVNNKFKNVIADWFMLEFQGYMITPNTLAFFLFFISVLVKLGIFPLHFHRFELFEQKKLETLIPVISGTGVGFIALMKFAPTLFPKEILAYAPTLAALGLFSVILAGISLLRVEGSRQRTMNLHLLISGLILFGFAGLSRIAWTGAWLMAIFQILIITKLVGLVVISERRASAFKMSELGRAPLYAVQSAFASMAAYGLPISIGFYAFVFTFWGTMQTLPKIFTLALISIPILALSSIKMIFFKIRGGGMVGVGSGVQQFQDMDKPEMIAILPLFFILLAAGVYPAMITGLITSTVDQLLIPILAVGK